MVPNAVFTKHAESIPMEHYMKNPVGFLISWFFNLGTKSGMPKYTAFLGSLQAAVLFIPESTWA